MNLRRSAAVATALVCALVAPSNAAGSVAMDGVRRTAATYKGELTAPAFTPDPERTPVLPLEPSLADCGAPGSCDITKVRLTLPKGSTSGKFRAVYTVPRELNAAVGMFNAEGERVGYADMLQNGDTLCCEVPTWRVSFAVSRLPAGDYTLVVFDRGGVGVFNADLAFRANPPDRQRGRR